MTASVLCLVFGFMSSRLSFKNRKAFIIDLSNLFLKKLLIMGSLNSFHHIPRREVAVFLVKAGRIIRLSWLLSGQGRNS